MSFVIHVEVQPVNYRGELWYRGTCSSGPRGRIDRYKSDTLRRDPAAAMAAAIEEAAANVRANVKINFEEFDVSTLPVVAPWDGRKVECDRDPDKLGGRQL